MGKIQICLFVSFVLLQGLQQYLASYPCSSMENFKRLFSSKHQNDAILKSDTDINSWTYDEIHRRWCSRPDSCPALKTWLKNLISKDAGSFWYGFSNHNKKGHLEMTLKVDGDRKGNLTLTFGNYGSKGTVEVWAGRFKHPKLRANAEPNEVKTITFEFQDNDYFVIVHEPGARIVLHDISCIDLTFEEKSFECQTKEKATRMVSADEICRDQYNDCIDSPSDIKSKIPCNECYNETFATEFNRLPINATLYPAMYRGKDFMKNVVTEEMDNTTLKSLVWVSEWPLYTSKRYMDTANKTVHGYNAKFSDMEENVTVQIHVKDWTNQTKMYKTVRSVLETVGRLPLMFRKRVTLLELEDRHGAFLASTGVYIPLRTFFWKRETKEEILMHEGAHKHWNSRMFTDDGLLCALASDKRFITEYARFEDGIETWPVWYALRYRKDRLTKEVAETIENAIPNHLRLFDEACNKNPEVCF